MIVFLDTSALVAIHIDGPARPAISAVLRDATPICASALALAEALVAIDRLTDEIALRVALEDAVRALWDRVHVVPLDQRSLDDAARLARAQPLRITHAIHLSAAQRLPRPVRFATVEPAQIPVALALGFDVVST